MLTNKSQKIMGICGWKNSGKTTLITALIPFFMTKNLRVGVIKKTHHQVLEGVPGKDSTRYQEVGASSNVLLSEKGWQMTVHTAKEQTMDATIQKILNGMTEDVILIEGYKFSHFPKIAVVDSSSPQGSTSFIDWPHVVGVASDEKPAQLPKTLSYCQRNDIATLYEWVMLKGLEI